MRAYLLGLVVALCAVTAEARLYRWVDEHGNVQFSDKPPTGQVKELNELDQRGMVRRAPEKKASSGELAQQASEQQMIQAQKRKDHALLQSFTRPEEIDLLRDRQISAVETRSQTNKLRSQGAQNKLKRLTAQTDALKKAGRTPNDTLQADLDATRKELDVLAAEEQKMALEITAIKERAEADKKRFQELRGSH